jgi:hypothetical protein
MEHAFDLAETLLMRKMLMEGRLLLLAANGAKRRANCR